MKKLSILALLMALTASDLLAFCGFYVAKADAKLFNKSSQVIIVRDGDRTVITMSNDFQGDVKDFAMVVPVPVVLQRDQIKTVNPAIFSKIDAYTAPRMAEYYDSNPCWVTLDDFSMADVETMSEMSPGTRPRRSKSNDRGVTIEAKYEVGEYDILILSAKESEGLEAWLIENGYKIPSGAKEVLQPYIRSNLKFFVVKVNLDRQKQSAFMGLTPLQISFNSNRFTLPIRLGMANATDDQDLIVYSFTRTGRVETTNYRTAQLPTDRNVPLFIQQDFGPFYQETFEKSWKREGKNSVMLEYAWDISGSQSVKCDPCATQPFTYQELADAGVWWLTQNGNWNANYAGELFVTRLHARYNRATFPQDLAFQITPNQERFQCRYVTRHPATGDLSCEEGQRYLVGLVQNRQKELQELAQLTGRSTAGHSDYINEYARLIDSKGRRVKDISLPTLPEGGGTAPNPNGLLYLALAFGIVLFGTSTLWFLRKRLLAVRK